MYPLSIQPFLRFVPPAWPLQAVFLPGVGVVCEGSCHLMGLPNLHTALWSRLALHTNPQPIPTPEGGGGDRGNADMPAHLVWDSQQHEGEIR